MKVSAVHLPASTADRQIVAVATALDRSMRLAFAAVAVTGCLWHASARTTAQHGSNDADTDQAIELAPPATDHRPVALARGRETMFVAGCNVACTDCWLGGYKTFVVGTLARTQARLFPAPYPPSAGYACGAEVAIGERVTLRAHSPGEGLVIETWRPFFANDYCPCSGTNVQTCQVDVTPEIAARYDRIYCGAEWRKTGHQIAR
jgi:hypothetical protein